MWRWMKGSIGGGRMCRSRDSERKGRIHDGT